MINRERQKKEVYLGEEQLFYDMDIETIKEWISKFEEMGAEKVNIDYRTDRCGDHEGTYMEFYGSRDETDSEYEERIKREEEYEKKRIEEEKKRKEEEIRKKNAQDMKDLETYLRLKERFEK